MPTLDRRTLVAHSHFAQPGRMLVRGLTRLFRPTLLLCIVLVILTPSLTVAGAMQQKSDSSPQCLDGGWQSLAPQEDPTTPFADREERKIEEERSRASRTSGDSL